jgi:uncharacterized protein YbaP (TraB family)
MIDVGNEWPPCPGCVIEDADALGAQVLWVLYECLEAADLNAAASFASHYALEVTLSAQCQCSPRSVHALVDVSHQLDMLSPAGCFFGVDPLDSRRVGWWVEGDDA